MNKKLSQKIVFGLITLVLSGILGLSLNANIYADSNADMVWDRCGSVATDSVFYYSCAKTALGLPGELTERDVTDGSELYNRLGGETSHGSFSFSDASDLLSADGAKSPAELDREATNCTKDASGWGWFACGLNKTASGLVALAYEKIQEYMYTDPAIFEAQTMHTAWNRFRILANFILVIMLMVMIISQITGMGVSNYGIKKSLPRLVALVVIVNLSFFFCRMAIDVANIIGDGIGTIFDGLSSAAKAKINFDTLTDGTSKTLMKAKIVGGGAILTGITAFFAGKTALASGQSIMVLVAVAVIAAVVALLMLLTVIQLRKALIIILTITSPVAVLLYALPGMKKTFNQWFGLFKGLLFAYPICALLVKGGAFAATILTAAMGVAKADGSPNFFTMVIAVAASVVPIFLIPNTIIKSAGVLGARLQSLSRKLSGALSGAVRGSRIGQRLDRGAKERANRMKAGVDRYGNETKLGRLTRSRSQRVRMDAAKRAQQDRALARSESHIAEMGEYEEMDQIAKTKEEELAAVNSDSDMEAKIDEIFSSGGSAREIAAELSGAVRHWGAFNDKNNADDVIAAQLDKLGDDPRSQEIRREVARKRLADSDRILKSKNGAMRQYYKTLASDNPPTGNAAKWSSPQGDHNQWVEKLVNSDDFTAEWLTGVAPPQIEQLEQYLKSGSGNNDIKQQIVNTYDQMKRTGAYQSATASDYVKLEAEVNKYKAAHRSSP